MLKRRLASALSCAALLLAFAPCPTLAQTQQTAPEKTPRLKPLFDESAARAKAGGPPTGADLERFYKWRRQEYARPPENGKWSTGNKVLIIAAIVGGVALIVWATANRADNPTPFCENAPSDLNCIP